MSNSLQGYVSIKVDWYKTANLAIARGHLGQLGLGWWDLSKAIMLTQQRFHVRAATPAEDSLIAHHFYHMWLDNQIVEAAIAPDWLEATLQFIHQARQTLSYQAFVAEVEGQVIGSAGCQRFAGLYPNIMKAKERCDG